VHDAGVLPRPDPSPALSASSFNEASIRLGAMAALVAATLSACALLPTGGGGSPISAAIGTAVREDAGKVVVVALGPRAIRAGLREGDRILGYNGIPVTDARQFARLVLDSRPGSVVRLEVLRDARRLVIPVDVRELDMAPTA
jgi:S1-C subfamily serine protease